MLKKNVGKLDRILRIVIGLALIAAFFLYPEANYRALYLIGIIPLVTGLVGSCGLYRVFGLSTCPMQKP
ncbi:MAG: hypothetical protein ACJA06_002011 [Halocynthiibacter sp.]|jgi:hypothetical protein